MTVCTIWHVTFRRRRPRDRNLYAAGNDMASIMGGNCPGTGTMLGPALTFGYIVGEAV
jgi:hypothetical protein